MPENTVRAVIENSLGYIFFIFMAMWGGTASYISRLKRSMNDFSFVELTGEWTISGFSGILTAYFCKSYGFDFYITAAAVGISGHMGGRGLFLIEQIVKNRANKWFGKFDEE